MTATTTLSVAISVDVLAEHVSQLTLGHGIAAVARHVQPYERAGRIGAHRVRIWGGGLVADRHSYASLVGPRSGGRNATGRVEQSDVEPGGFT